MGDGDGVTEGVGVGDGIGVTEGVGVSVSAGVPSGVEVTDGDRSEERRVGKES